MGYSQNLLNKVKKMINFVTDVMFEIALICNCLYLTELQVTTLITTVH